MEHVMLFEEFEFINEELSALQKEYREYFRFMLDKYGVKSPAKLSDEKKTEFFNEIRKNWVKGSGVKAEFKKEMECKDDNCKKITESINIGAIKALVVGMEKQYPGLNEPGTTFEVTYITDPDQNLGLEEESITKKVNASSAMEALFMVLKGEYADIELYDVQSWSKRKNGTFKFELDSTGDEFHIFDAIVKKIN